MIDDDEIMKKLLFTRKVYLDFKPQTETGLFNKKKEANNNLLLLKDAVDNITGLANDIMQVELTRDFVKLTGAGAVGLSGNLAMMGKSVGTAVIHEATDMETYVRGIEIATMYQMKERLERFYSLAYEGGLNKYENARDGYVGMLQTIATLPNLLPSICGALGIDDIDDMGDKLIWWTREFLTGLATGQNIDEDIVEIGETVLDGIQIGYDLLKDIQNTEAGEVFAATEYILSIYPFGNSKALMAQQIAGNIADFMETLENINGRLQWMVPFINADRIFREENVLGATGNTYWSAYTLLDDIMEMTGPSLENSYVRLAKGESATIKIHGLNSDAKVEYEVQDTYTLSVSEEGKVTVISANAFDKRGTVIVVIKQEGKTYRRYYTVEVEK